MTAIDTAINFLNIPYRLNEKSSFYTDRLKNTKLYIHVLCNDSATASVSSETYPSGKERKGFGFAWVDLEHLTVFTE